MIVARIAISGLHFEKSPINKEIIENKISSSKHSVGGYLLASGKQLVLENEKLFMPGAIEYSDSHQNLKRFDTTFKKNIF